MDLYIFYNCINKIINIIEISEHELNNSHVDFVNNPLTLVNQSTSVNHNLIGGAAAILPKVEHNLLLKILNL